MKSKFKIENVEHSFSCSEDSCCLIDYYELSDTIYQFNYNSYDYAKNEAYTDATIGIWRVKPTDK